METIITLQGINPQGNKVQDQFYTDGTKTRNNQLKKAFAHIYHLANVIIL